MMKINDFLLIMFLFTVSCTHVRTQENSSKNSTENSIVMGADRVEEYLPLLKNKRVGMVVNQSSTTHNMHLVDFLLTKGVKIQKIFAPEHGFRGNIDRGKHINNEIDEKTALPIVSMYGKNRRPTDEQMADIDVMIFDIQDAGARFFTYISSMNEAMEACAKNNIPFIVLDRPNPLGDYVDGPIRKAKFKSFVGMHPIPIVHGLTVAELAQMINGEKWLEGGKKCNLILVPMQNYTHARHYSLPIKPSPNLPNDLSIRLYPSLCFFEATQVSIGRGTNFPFQVVGYPNPDFGDSLFIPHDIPGMQIDPVQEGKVCYGIDLRQAKPDTIYFTLRYVIDFAKKFRENGDTLVSNKRWFNLLAGNDELLKQINSGMSEKEIKESWKKDLDQYKAMRKKYLLYPED